jgi:acetyl esterase
MEDVGFVLRVREAGHRMFRTPDRDVHIHVYSSGDQAIADYLDLRDWLRVDADDRALYADVKRDLVTRRWSDMNHYAAAKTDVIQQVLGRARTWRASRGEHPLLGPDAAVLADDGLRAWVLAVRSASAPSAESIGVDALRAAQRARAAIRPTGPAVHHIEDLVAADRIPVRVYRPSDDPRPVVLFAHGGGFVMGDLDSHDSTCRRLAVTADVIVVSVGYRLAPEHPGPAAVDDVCAAYDWALGQDQLFAATDDRRAALAGDSAGGAIAVLAAVRLVSAGKRPLALLLAYPNADMTMSGGSVQEKGAGWGLDGSDLAWFVQAWVPDEARRRDGRVSPLHADLAGVPPTILTTAEHDPLRDEGRALAERMRAAGVSVEHLHEGGLVHGFLGLGTVSAAAADAGQDLFARFGRLLRDQT